MTLHGTAECMLYGTAELVLMVLQVIRHYMALWGTAGYRAHLVGGPRHRDLPDDVQDQVLGQQPGRHLAVHHKPHRGRHLRRGGAASGSVCVLCGGRELLAPISGALRTASPVCMLGGTSGWVRFRVGGNSRGVEGREHWFGRVCGQDVQRGSDQLPRPCRPQQSDHSPRGQASGEWRGAPCPPPTCQPSPFQSSQRAA